MYKIPSKNVVLGDSKYQTGMLNQTITSKLTTTRYQHFNSDPILIHANFDYYNKVTFVSSLFLVLSLLRSGHKTADCRLQIY